MKSFKILLNLCKNNKWLNEYRNPLLAAISFETWHIEHYYSWFDAVTVQSVFVLCRMISDHRLLNDEWMNILHSALNAHWMNEYQCTISTLHIRYFFVTNENNCKRNTLHFSEFKNNNQYHLRSSFSVPKIVSNQCPYSSFINHHYEMSNALLSMMKEFVFAQRSSVELAPTHIYWHKLTKQFNLYN